MATKMRRNGLSSNTQPEPLVSDKVAYTWTPLSELEQILDMLRVPYEAWVKAEGLTLASADELLNDDNLKSYQRTWLMRFAQLWEETESMDGKRRSGNSGLTPLMSS